MRYWAKADPRTLIRILDLVDATVRDPRAGIGKPEALRYKAKGSWSRRITGEHRLTYIIFDDRVEFLQCRYHYEK
jgi:toxin YoeB